MAENTPYDPALVDAAIQRRKRAIGHEASDWAQDVKERMVAEAPWTDRGGKDSPTGLTARESLATQVATGSDGALHIIASSDRRTTRAWRGWSQAPVAAFLELGTRKMRQKYEIVWPTLVMRSPDLKHRLQAVMGTPGTS